MNSDLLYFTYMLGKRGVTFTLQSHSNKRQFVYEGGDSSYRSVLHGRLWLHGGRDSSFSSLRLISSYLDQCL